MSKLNGIKGKAKKAFSDKGKKFLAVANLLLNGGNPTAAENAKVSASMIANNISAKIPGPKNK